MSASTIHLSLDGSPPLVTIRREDEVDELFWARLRGELSAEGHPTADHIRAPLERVLRNRPVIRTLCRRFNVDLTADAAATEALTRALGEESRLQEALRDMVPLTPDEVARQLLGSRYTRQLRPFQLRDLGHLLALPHGANFSVPGAGKTAVTYALYEAGRTRGRGTRMLVVAPLSAFDAWETEAEECFDPVPVVGKYEPSARIPSETEILLVNYQKLLNPEGFAKLVRWVTEEPTHVVLDEAHRMKRGRAGAWGSACLDLSWYAQRRDVLTGTPAPQHPRDLEALLEFSWPANGSSVLPPEAFQPVPQDGAGQRIANAIRPLFVRTRKAELGLSEPTMRVLQFELDGLQREIYLAIMNQYSGEIPLLRADRHRFAEMRKVVMYLLEAATNPALLPLGASPDDPPVFQHPRAQIPVDSTLAGLILEYGKYETPAKFRRLGEMLKTNVELGRKTLVWSNFVRNLELLKRDLGRYQPAMIHGGVPTVSSASATAVTREAELERFRGDPACGVLLANPAAMSEGISLHKECHDAIYLERTFNAGQYLQSVDRIHRLGLDEGIETRITFLVTKDTIDEVVHERVAAKAARLGEMLNDPDISTMALPDEDDLQDVDSGLGRPIDDDEDVAALFAHLRGESVSG